MVSVSYENIDNQIKDELSIVCKTDEFGLNPESLYQNICRSKGDVNKLAELFEVDVELVKKIKEINQ
jgi:hypothetical protein